MAIAFADLAGYTRLTEEAGEEQALDVVERFVEAVDETLPEDARVIKTIGDEVMVVGSDPGALVEWAVGFQAAQAGRAAAAAHRHPRAAPRSTATATTSGARSTSPRASGARAAGGEVLVTRAVVEAAGRHLQFRADRRGQAQGLPRGRPSCSSRGAGAE